jgi:hypothetical protein
MPTADPPRPKHWTRSVQAAILHIISLAKYALAYARGRDDLCRDRTRTCWNNGPFTAHLDHHTLTRFVATLAVRACLPIAAQKPPTHRENP